MIIHVYDPTLETLESLSQCYSDKLDFMYFGVRWFLDQFILSFLFNLHRYSPGNMSAPNFRQIGRKLLKS